MPPDRGGAALPALYLVVFVNFLAVAVVYPLLYEYAVLVGATPQTFGLLNSVFHLAQVAGSPTMHWIVRRHGRHRALHVGFVGSALSYVGVAYAPSLSVMFAARIPIGVVQKTLTIASAYAAELADPAEQATALGRVRGMLYLGFLFGPHAGSYLAAAYGLRAPAVASAVLFAVAAVCTAVCLPEVPAPAAGPAGGAPGGGAPRKEEKCNRSKNADEAENGGGLAAAARAVWACADVRSMMAAMLLLEAAVLLSRHTLPVALKDAVGLDKKDLGAYWSAAYGATAVAGMYVVRPVARRFGDHATAVHGAAVAAVCLALWAAHTSTPAFPFYAGYLATNLVCETCLKSQLTSHPAAPPADAVLGLLDATKAAVGVSIPVVAGWLAAHSPAYPFMVACALCLLAVVPMRCMRNVDAKEKRV